MSSSISRLVNRTLSKFKKTVLACMSSCVAKDSKDFCRKLANIESRDYVFEVRHEDVWMKPYRVEFYDLHRWNGQKIHWNCHDIGSGEGITLEDAWRDMEKTMLEYEHARSREEAVINYELKARRDLPRGWGVDEDKAYYARNWML